jgi:hypothetical protein
MKPAKQYMSDKTHALFNEKDFVNMKNWDLLISAVAQLESIIGKIAKPQLAVGNRKHFLRSSFLYPHHYLRLTYPKISEAPHAREIFSNEYFQSVGGRISRRDRKSARHLSDSWDIKQCAAHHDAKCF